MKKIMGFALIACLSVSFLAHVSENIAFAAEPTTGLAVEEMVVDDTETSEADFEWEGMKIKKYIGSSEEVVIPSKCTEIGNGAFLRCTSLKKITIPNGVRILKSDAFAWCTNLTSVVIPDSVTYVTGNTFRNCDNLTKIKVASGNPVYDSRENCNAVIETGL